MSRLALVLSLEEGRDEVVEGSDDGGGVDSKLAVISLPFIEVDADNDMEVFVTLDVAMAADWFPSCVVQYSTVLLGKLFWVVSNLYFYNTLYV